MPTTPEAIAADIAEAATAGFRGRLIARGQARAIIWRDGVLPPDAPAFAPQLSYDLHSYGYALFGLGLRLRELGGEAAQARTAFEQAATALEAVIAKGNREETDRDFHFIVAAASYHLAHLSARAFSLLAFVEADENFAPTERVLALLMRRNFHGLRTIVLDFRASCEGSDARIAAGIQANLDQLEAAAELAEDGNDFLFEGLDIALVDTFMSAMALFLLALERGEQLLLDQALERLRTGLSICSEMNMIPQWWAHRIAIHLLSDLWSSTFHERVPLQPVGGEAADYFWYDELFVSTRESQAAQGALTGRVHLAFQAASPEAVDRFHAAAVAAGGRDNGAPGERPYHPGYYAAFVLDPDGNNIEAVYHGAAERSAASVQINFPTP